MTAPFLLNSNNDEASGGKDFYQPEVLWERRAPLRNHALGVIRAIRVGQVWRPVDGRVSEVSEVARRIDEGIGWS